jgi:hypothetical protein
MNPPDHFELLSIDEFCKRLNVGRTTIFKWKREGTLIAGRHFFQKRRIVRYIWSLNVIRELQEKGDAKPGIADKEKMDSVSKKAKAAKKSTINFEY